MTSSLTPHERALMLTDGCDHVETIRELEARLQRGAPLRIKLGLDPTTSDLHVGHAVVLRLLQRFVEDGHDVTLLIGDFTARIGDPSGRNALRPPLSGEQIDANMITYAQQAGKVLDMERVTLRYNREWLGELDLVSLIKLMSQTTVAQLLERNDFRQRYESGTAIALHEFLYPVAQAYDSVALRCDVELGGSDQLFNLLLGRPYQQHAGMAPQICATVPLLVGLDGQKKMSKSLGNHIALTDAPSNMFGKTMSLPDAAIPQYAVLATGRSAAEARSLTERIQRGDAQPMDEKKRIAEDLVALYHGAESARAARDYFERTVQRKEEIVTRVERWEGERSVADVIARVYAISKRDAKAQMAQGAVRVDGAVVTDPAAAWPDGASHRVRWGSKRPAVQVDR